MATPTIKALRVGGRFFMLYRNTLGHQLAEILRLLPSGKIELRLWRANSRRWTQPQRWAPDALAYHFIPCMREDKRLRQVMSLRA